MHRRAVKSLVLVVASTFTAKASFASEPFEGLDAYIEASMARWRVPGLAVAVVREGNISFVRGYGVRSAGGKDRVDEHTVFAVGSLTKSFTSALAAHLAHEGTLGLDDPVTKWLRDFNLYDPWISHEVTIRDLLSNRTGIQDRGFLWWGTGFGSQQILERLRLLDKAGPFRARYSYNNVMFLAAGECFAQATGKTWGDLIRSHILTKLSMGETNLSTTELDKHTNVARPHKLIDGEVRVIKFHNLDNVQPACCINSSAADMALWLQMQTNRGRAGQEQVINAAALEETWSPHTVIAKELQSIPSCLRHHVDFPSYALGWLTMTYKGKRVVWHNGAIDGMHSVMGFLPDLRSGVVVLSNLDQKDQVLPEAILYRCLDALLGMKPEDWSQELFREYQNSAMSQNTTVEFSEQRRPIVSTPTLPLTRYAGIYKSDLYGRLEIRLDKASSHRLCCLLGAVSGKLAHICSDSFRFYSDDKVCKPLDLTFIFDFEGAVKSVRCQELGLFHRVDF